MKMFFALILSIVSLTLHAQTYQAPKIKFQPKDSTSNAQKADSESWRSDYRVEDKAQPQRDLASDSEEWVDYSEREGSRDPSSVKPDSEKEKGLAPETTPGLKPWHWKWQDPKY